MAQGPAFGARRGLPPHPDTRAKGEVRPPNTVQHATQGSADIVFQDFIIIIITIFIIIIIILHCIILSYIELRYII